MANKYCNIKGPSAGGNDTLSSMYPKINNGFAGVEVDVSKIKADAIEEATQRQADDEDLQQQITENKANIESKLQENKVDIETKVQENKEDIETKLQEHKDSDTAHSAENIVFEPGESGIIADNVDSAIKEVKEEITQIITTPIDGQAAAEELVSSRRDKVKGINYDSLPFRLDAMSTDIENTKKPQYSPPLSNTAPIFSIGKGKNEAGQDVDLSASVTKGQVSVGFLGNTAKNEITNGNFVNTTGWSTASSSATLSAVSNVLSVTGTGISASPQTYQTLNKQAVLNNKIYSKIKARVTNSNCTSIQLFIGDNVTGLASKTAIVTISNPVQNQWYDVDLKGVKTIDAAYSGTLRLYIVSNYADSATANGKVMEVKDVMAIDMGTSGELYSLTVDQMNSRFPYWFDGTKSTLSQRISSYNENIVDFENDVGMLRLQGLGYAQKVEINGVKYWKVKGSAKETISSVKLFKGRFLPGTQYTLTNTYYDEISGQVGKFQIFYTDGTHGFSPNPTTSATKYTFTSAVGKTIDYISFAYTNSGAQYTFFSTDDFQLEKGSTSTTYKKSSVTIVYTPSDIVLRSVGTAKDEVKDGVKTQNVSDTIIIDGNIGWTTAGETTSTTSYFIRTNDNWTAGKNVLHDVANSAIGRCVDGDLLSIATGITSTVQRGLQLTASNGRLWIAIEKSKIDAQVGATTLDKFKAYLNTFPITLTYQLAAPIITKIEGMGQITAEPGGVVIVDTAVKDKATYDAKINIRNADKPIKVLEKVTKKTINKDGTITETDIPIQDCPVASDGKSFTSSKLANGDTVEYIYLYEGILPTVTHSFPMNIKALAESNTKGITHNTSEIIKLNDFTVAYLLWLETRVSIIEANVIRPTTGDVTYYINAVSGNNSNNGLTEGTAWKDFANFSKLPRIDHNVTIRLANGNYPDLIIEGINAKGRLLITGNNVSPNLVTLPKIQIKNNKLDEVVISYLKPTLEYDDYDDVAQVLVRQTPSVRLLGLDLTTACRDLPSIKFVNAHGEITQSTISNTEYDASIVSVNSTVLSVQNSGVNNATGLSAIENGVILKQGTQPGGGVPEATSGGGRIINRY